MSTAPGPAPLTDDELGQAVEAYAAAFLEALDGGEGLELSGQVRLVATAANGALLYGVFTVDAKSGAIHYENLGHLITTEGFRAPVTVLLVDQRGVFSVMAIKQDLDYRNFVPPPEGMLSRERGKS
jgi:hypothetical protein